MVISVLKMRIGIVIMCMNCFKVFLMDSLRRFICVRLYLKLISRKIGLIIIRV